MANRRTPRCKFARPHLAAWLVFSGIFLFGCSSPRHDTRSNDGSSVRWERQALTQLFPHDSAALQRLGLAHALTRNVAAGAKQGPITEDELASWSQYHWTQVDRPSLYRTLHAVVRVKDDASTEEVKQAERVALAIHSAVQGVTDVKAFEQRAKEVATHGVEVKIEGLDFVAEDGRVMRLGGKGNAQTGTYDPAFSRAAAALTSVGQISPVVRSAFGFHVIRLEETLPPLRLEESARRSAAQDEVFDRRARLVLQALLAKERQRVNPAVERSAEQATAKVSVE